MSSGNAAGRPRFRWRGLVVPVVLVAIAEIAAQATHLDSDSLAAPSAIIVGLGHLLADGTILKATRDTLIAAVAGLGIGFSLGLVIGTIFGTLPIANRLFEFTVEAIRPIPPVALIPIALLVFGFGYRLEFSVVAFATLWPTLIFTRAAIAGVEPRLIELSRALRFGMFDRVVKIVLPAALPRIFVALRLAAGVALIVSVTVEISANTLGLGYAMMNAQQALRPAEALALLVWVGVVGWTLNAVLLLAQRKLFGPAALVEMGR